MEFLLKGLLFFCVCRRLLALKIYYSYYIRIIVSTFLITQVSTYSKITDNKMRKQIIFSDELETTSKMLYALFTTRLLFQPWI